MQELAKPPKLYIVKTIAKKPNAEAFTVAFGERLQSLREDTIYKRPDVARRCGVKPDTVRQWEDGRAVMPAIHWPIVCEMLYIDPWQLLTGRSRREYPDLPAHLRNPAKKPRKRA